MDRKNKYVSVQETRAQITRDKLLKAAVDIVNKYGMKHFTVRNICDEAGLSTGSFYNLFESKDELVSYYLKYVFLSYKEKATQEAEPYNSIEKCLLIYRYYVACCKKAGLEFMSAVYAANTNPVFNFMDRTSDEELVLDRVREYIEEGKASGELRSDVGTDQILLNIASIVTGSIFYWCVFEGDVDIAYQVDNLLKTYLLTLAVDPALTVDLKELPHEGRFAVN